MRLGIRNGLIKRRRDGMFQPGEIEVSDVYHLPIIKAFADRIDLVNIINRQLFREDKKGGVLHMCQFTNVS